MGLNSFVAACSEKSKNFLIINSLYLSTKNHPVDMMAFAMFRWLLDVPDPVMLTKEELERKYQRQARYEREKERQ